VTIGIEEFRQQARDWLAGQRLPDPALEGDQRFDELRDWQRRLYEAGWLGLTWPAESGGRDLSALHQAVFNRELAAARAPRPAGVVGIEVVGPTIVRFGTEEQRRERLPRVLRGDDIWCQGFSETEAGSDLAALSARAEPADGGWLVNGHKVWTTWAHKADWCAVLARTSADGSRYQGISYLMVPLTAPGVRVSPLVQLNGDTEFGEVFLEDVFVPSAALIGEAGQGWHYAMHTLSSERGSLVLRKAADLTAAYQDLLAEVARGPVDDEQLARIGQLAASLFALDAQCDRIVERMAARPDEASPADSLDKAFLTEVEQDLFSFARDCLGAYAAVPDAADAAGPRLNGRRWAHDYYYSRAASIYGGSAQIQRNIIAERLLGLPREARA
jgi:alkylation response protein AidB-like acyl-CoA dehydrogenase